MKGFVGVDVLTAVWCADCSDEGRRSPGCLGQLTRAKRNGTDYFAWQTWHNRGVKGPDGGRGQVLEAVALGPRDLAGLVPGTLPVLCERHGTGTVSVGDVVGKRGNIVLKLKATT